MKMPCPLTENSKKFKFTSLGSPYQSYTEAQAAKTMAQKLLPGKTLVIASYKEFGYHELDETLKKAWVNSAIGWDHPLVPPGSVINAVDAEYAKFSKIIARGYFVCEKAPSTQPQEFFQKQSDEYWELLERKGHAGC